MANTNYKKFYSILGVFQDDDWGTVRTAYKRQIRRWHPDHFQDMDQRKIAEDKSKDINLAYQMLDDYFREFGSLPPEDTTRQEKTTSTGDQWPSHEYDAGPKHDEFSKSNHGQTSFHKSEQPRRAGYAKMIVVGVVVAIAYIMLEPLFTDSTDSHNAAETTLLGYQDSGLAADNFTPHQTESSAHAMASIVDNTGDAQTDWQVENKGMGFTPSSSLNSGHPAIISVGSSKQDVLAIQGRPLRQTDTAWDYGLSRINFENGKVTGWHESPMNPLKVK